MAKKEVKERKEWWLTDKLVQWTSLRVGSLSLLKMSSVGIIALCLDNDEQSNDTEYMLTCYF